VYQGLYVGTAVSDFVIGRWTLWGNAHNDREVGYAVMHVYLQEADDLSEELSAQASEWTFLRIFS
jgi:hypothetical protein